MSHTFRRSTVALLIAFLVPLALYADTLVLRDGTRVQGELLAVRGSTIEFEERRGGRARTIRVDRDDVLRIEFDNAGIDFGNEFGPGGGRPSGLREREVSVESAAGWIDTGLTVRAGQTVYFEASGRVRWGRDRRDGPGGENGSPYNAGRPMPNRPAAALIGRVGDGQDYFFIGDEAGPIRIRGNGRLYLGVNDDFLQDNSGAFRVVVYY